MKKNELKGFFLSLLIHSSLIGAVFVYQDESQKVASEEKVVSLDLMSYKLPNKVEEPPKPQEEPKPTKKPKPIKKEQPEPIKKIEPIKKEKPKEIKKELKPHNPIEYKTKEPEPVMEPKEIIEENYSQEEAPIEEAQPMEEIKQSHTDKTQSKEDHRQAFIKTNFAIIRDMVLSDLSYPKIAKRMGWEGVVSIELQVSADGELLHVKLLESSGKKALDEAALEAALKLRGKNLPKPKEITTIILPITFKLN